MKAVVLSVIPRERRLLRAASCLVDWELQRAGYQTIERFEVDALKLGFCQGEFDCWLRTPGRCKIHDSEQAILEAIPGSDALVLLGPLAFGGHCSALKRAVDRLIGLVSPFFEQRAGLTHHQARYAHYPRLYSIGVIPARDDEQTATFHALNDANAINLCAPERGALVLDEEHSEHWQDALRGMLARPRNPGASIASRKALTSDLLEAAHPESLSGRPLKSAAILIGSAKKKGTSASEHMARTFVSAFSRLGVECRLHFATEFVHDSDQALAAARSIATADLFLLATPLYVDSFPSLATRALELVEVARRTARRDAVFVPLVNCGFPEPEHTRTALHIARNFARAAGYGFAGALPLGAGGVVTPERSLEEPRPPVSHVVRAIELSAPALAAGGPVPERALRAILGPPLPEFLYRIAGELGFRRESHRLGTHQRELRAAPFGPAR